MEAVELFIAEVEEERAKRKWSIRDLSEEAFNSPSSYTQVRRKLSCSTGTLQKIADALDMKLIICLGDKE